MLKQHKEALKVCPKWLPNSLNYEVLMGSHAYGCHTEDSDHDIYGWCFPPRDIQFPHTAGHIPGFGKQPPSFKQFNPTFDDVDFTIYGIVKYFDLCMGCNPNMIDSLFVPDNCIVHITPVGQMVRDKRHLFLSKKAWHTFKGYSYQMMHKLNNKKPTGKRLKLVEEFGYDVKFAYHCVRLLDEIEQILELGDIDLQRDKERLKEIRRGGFSLENIKLYVSNKKVHLEKLYEECALPYEPREEEIKELLMNCLEHHYGCLDNIISRESRDQKILNDMQSVLDNYRG
jgi:predicted nucleotidyltransferase